MNASLPVFGLILIAVFSGILFIVFAILDIIAIINRKKNKIFIYTALVILSIIGIISPLVTMFSRTREFFKESVKSAQNNMRNDLEYGDSTIEFEKLEYRDSIKKFSDNYKDIDTNYFTSYGKEEWYRVPLVFPYSLNMISELKYASLKNDKNTNYQTGEYDSNILENISYAAFDSNYLLCRIEKIVNVSPEDNTAEPDFVIFNLKTGKTERYKNFETLLKSAKKLGYVGREDLVPVSEIYYQWF